MKHRLSGITLALLMLAGASFAQVVYSSPNGPYNHGEVGAFFNYTLLHNANNTSFYGLGGRVGFNLSRHALVEFEGAEDFERNVTVQVGFGNGSFASVPSRLRLAHFLAGPTFQLGGSSPVHVFATVKGGFINFSTNTNFFNQVTNIQTSNTDGVLYPAGGVEFFAGWVGARFEAGDEIYFNNGANNNLRITAGPVFRF